jgi:hypothetical protein
MSVRWRDDKATEDATITRELAELFLTARRTPTGAQSTGGWQGTLACDGS